MQQNLSWKSLSWNNLWLPQILFLCEKQTVSDCYSNGLVQDFHLLPVYAFSSLFSDNYYIILKYKSQRILPIMTILYHLMGKPFPAMEANSENDASYCPVSKHSNPDCHWTKPLETDKIYTKTKSEHPHSSTGCDHGKFHITGGSQAVCRYKSHYPYDWFDNCDPGHHMEAHFCTFRFHSTQFCYRNS